MIRQGKRGIDPPWLGPEGDMRMIGQYLDRLTLGTRVSDCPAVTYRHVCKFWGHQEVTLVSGVCNRRKRGKALAWIVMDLWVKWQLAYYICIGKLGGLWALWHWTMSTPRGHMGKRTWDRDWREAREWVWARSSESTGKQLAQYIGSWQG